MKFGYYYDLCGFLQQWISDRITRTNLFECLVIDETGSIFWHFKLALLYLLTEFPGDESAVITDKWSVYKYSSFGKDRRHCSLEYGIVNVHYAAKAPEASLERPLAMYANASEGYRQVL